MVANIPTAEYIKNGGNKVKGCLTCPYSGHMEIRECPNAYTEISHMCGMYSNEPLKRIVN